MESSTSLHYSFLEKMVIRVPTDTFNKNKLNKEQNFAVGDLVIVRNKNTPKSHWPLAQIVSIYPGNDGIVRTVKIQTPSEVY